MSQATTLSMSGRTEGNLRFCTLCGGTLALVDGTDPEQTDELGGFEEEYQCESCGATGSYTHRYHDSKETFSGACAGEHPL